MPLGVWPTPLTERVIDGRPVWIKHEGDAHPTYGGNKVRTLEVWLGHARERGARRIWAIGAYGSNHTIATLIHAPTAGLTGGAIVFPQPASAWAAENCGAIIAAGCPIVRLHNVVEVPFAAWWIARRERDAVVMPPGGATPIGTFGALSAAFEIAEQIAAGAAPPPAKIVVPVGSTCTTAGLLAGIALAQQVGVWPWPAPIIHGVRVTPWPVTSRLRTADLARRTLVRVARLGGPRVELGFGELVRRLVIDGRELGPGYGRTTPRCDAAMRDLAGAPPRLDAVYAGKAAAALLRLHRAGEGPLMFWASKSSARLAAPDRAALDRAPAALVNWLDRAPAPGRD
ncbi:MAG TPA: pyridoxal-phosphate dependent enzyme [Kofleriaceae bacterium]|nr:pyridoxal-phosphate dependent enzyme [Kofleriaceae bacterium]